MRPIRPVPEALGVPLEGPAPPSPAGSAARRARHRLLVLAKLAVTAGLLAVFSSRVDLASLGQMLARADPVLLAAALGLLVLEVIAAGVRWHVVGRAMGGALDLARALRFTFTAQFLGQLLPGGLGQDAVRGWLAWRSGERPRPLIGSLFLDRICAMAGLIAVVLASLVVLAPRAPKGTAAALLVLSGALLAGLFLALHADRLPVPTRLRHRWVEAARGLLRDLRAPLLSRRFRLSLGISAAIHSASVLVVALIARALGLEIEFSAILATVPVAVLLMAIPVSISGWGVREGAMVAGLGMFGVPETEAFAISVTFGLGILAAALPGSMLWAVNYRRYRSETPFRPENHVDR